MPILLTINTEAIITASTVSIKLTIIINANGSSAFRAVSDIGQFLQVAVKRQVQIALKDLLRNPLPDQMGTWVASVALWIRADHLLQRSLLNHIREEVAEALIAEKVLPALERRRRKVSLLTF
jgi:hypothetical protein